MTHMTHMTRMRQATRTLMAAIALVSAAAMAAGAQEMRSGGGAPRMWPPYDRAREITVTGKIVDTETIASPVDGSEFLILNLTVKGEPYHVMAAPAAFIRKSGFAFPGGAEITVTGFPGSVVRSEPAMTGGRIVVGGKTLDLRDPAGKPVWSTER